MLSCSRSFCQSTSMDCLLCIQVTSHCFGYCTPDVCPLCQIDAKHHRAMRNSRLQNIWSVLPSLHHNRCVHAQTSMIWLIAFVLNAQYVCVSQISSFICIAFHLLIARGLAGDIRSFRRHPWVWVFFLGLFFFCFFMILVWRGRREDGQPDTTGTMCWRRKELHLFTRCCLHRFPSSRFQVPNFHFPGLIPRRLKCMMQGLLSMFVWLFS